VAAHVAIEWMAQACGAYVGVTALEAGQPIRLGFLLGTRDFQATAPWFLEGERLNVTVTLAYMDAEMGSLRLCRHAGPRWDQVAKARLTLYRPDDAMALITAQAG